MPDSCPIVPDSDDPLDVVVHDDDALGDEMPVRKWGIEVERAAEGFLQRLLGRLWEKGRKADRTWDCACRSMDALWDRAYKVGYEDGLEEARIRKEMEDDA